MANHTLHTIAVNILNSIPIYSRYTESIWMVRNQLLSARSHVRRPEVKMVIEPGSNSQKCMLSQLSGNGSKWPECLSSTCLGPTALPMLTHQGNQRLDRNECIEWDIILDPFRFGFSSLNFILVPLQFTLLYIRSVRSPVCMFSNRFLQSSAS